MPLLRLQGGDPFAAFDGALVQAIQRLRGEDPRRSLPLQPPRSLAPRPARNKAAQLAHELLRRRRDDHRARGFQGAQTTQFHRVQQREETGLLPQKLARPTLQIVSKHMPVARLAERSGDDPRARRGARQFRVRRNDALEQSEEGAQAPQRDPQLMHRFRVAGLAQRRNINREVIETVAKNAPDGAVEGFVRRQGQPLRLDRDGGFTARIHDFTVAGDETQRARGRSGAIRARATMRAIHRRDPYAER